MPDPFQLVPVQLDLADLLADPRPAGQSVDFARAVAFGVGDLDLADLEPGARAGAERIAGWMRDCGVERDEAYKSMSEVRAVLRGVAGLDPLAEPVPLRVADPAQSLLIMALYLDGLVMRVLGALGEGAAGRRGLLAEVVARLRS